MEIRKVHLVYFSATFTTRKVVREIGRVIGAEVVEHDVTCAVPACETVLSAAGDLLVVGVPVYAGRVPAHAAEALRMFRGDGVPAVLVCVYGNRDYDDALVELQDIVEADGFKAVAAGAFVARHCIFPKVAAGRPDDEDLKFAEEFGAKVRIKLSNAADAEHLYGVDVQKIQRPKQPFFPLFRFLRRVIKLRKSGVPMPRTPQVDENLCTHCGLCVKRCPAGAIVKGEECVTNAEKCIRCCACVKGCPQKARTFDTPFAALLHDCFQRPKENRIIL